jgi:hypothetical protein
MSRSVNLVQRVVGYEKLRHVKSGQSLMKRLTVVELHNVSRTLSPHGQRERERRMRQIERGQLRVENGLDA